MRDQPSGGHGDRKWQETLNVWIVFDLAIRVHHENNDMSFGLQDFNDLAEIGQEEFTGPWWGSFCLEICGVCILC